MLVCTLSKQNKTKKNSHEPRGVCYPLPQPLPLLPVKVKRCHLSLCAHALSTSHQRLRGFWRPTHPFCLQAGECRRCHRCCLPPFHIYATHKRASYPFTPSSTNISRVVYCETFLVSLGGAVIPHDEPHLLLVLSPGVMLSALRLEYGQNIPADVKQQVFTRAALIGSARSF